LGLLAWACGGHAAPQEVPGPGQRPTVTYEELRATFPDPPALYAPFAFWFWDAPLDRDLAARMAREMCRQGLNPGYVHGRSGLPREEWLSPEWFAAVEAAAGEARAAGMHLGYCDEYGWPSGQADGRVLAAHPELASCTLEWQVRDLAPGEKLELPPAFFTVAARHAPADAGRDARAAMPELGQWIWHPDPHEGEWIAFRRTLALPAGREIAAARASVTADDEYVLFVNGQRVGGNAYWPQIGHHDLTPLLESGANALGVRARNSGGDRGLILGVTVVFADGGVERIASDDGWRCTPEAQARGAWRAEPYDDRSWAGAATVAPSITSPPWNLPPGGGVHPPETIESSTLRRIDAGEWTAPDDGTWRVYTFTKAPRPGFDGSRVNYLDRRLPEAFLEIAHEPYAESLGELFGDTLPGVFVDNEGDYGFKLAWSDDLDREYRQLKGRDLRDWMPLLIDEDVEGRWVRARWDWHDVVSEIYADSYLGSVSRWLEERGLYCVSNLWEETLFAQAFLVGDYFRAQRAVTLPGNDCLLERAFEVHDFKEAQSVSEFEGRRFQSEILGLAGWGMTPVTMKRAVDCATAWGVSHLVPHGVNLNRDLATIPYPPDWYSANPYWRHLHLWTDYARRASYVNSHGRTAPDVLLLNPMDSVWALLGGEFVSPRFAITRSAVLLRAGLPPVARGSELNQVERVYAEAIEELTAARIEFLVTDRHYLRQMEVAEGGEFVRGEHRFRTLVLPPLHLLPLDVAQRIVDFARAGGAVVALGRLPDASAENGLGCSQIAELMEQLEALPSFHATVEETGAVDALRPRIAFESEAFDLIQLQRRIDGRDFFWLVNGTDRAQVARLRLRDVAGAAAIWDCATGEITPAWSFAAGSDSLVELAFDSYQAFWLVFDPEEEPLGPKPIVRELAKTLTLDGPWRVRIDRDAQPPPVAPLPELSEALLDAEGDVRTLAPWLTWDLGHFTGVIDYRISFDSPSDGGRVFLNLGRVTHTVEVFVNGNPVGARLWPPFEFEIGAAVRRGENELVVRVGNLLASAMAHHVEAGTTPWRPRPPRPAELDAGLLGPVVIRWHF